MSKEKKGGLGRGLSSLFEDSFLDPKPESIIAPEEITETINLEKMSEVLEGQEEKVIYVNINNIKPNSMQPRKEFDEKSLEELADSIKEHGVIQPVILRPMKKGFELVAGERRWRAARKAGLKEIPAIVRKLDDKQNAFIALIENMQREDLNIIEEGLGIEELINNFGLTQEEAGKAVGKSRSYITNALRICKLPEDIKELVSAKKLSAGHARAIAGLKGEKLQIEAAKKAAEEGWSVRKIEEYTCEIIKPGRKKIKKKGNPEIKDIEDKLKESFGTKVSIKGSEKKGKIELEYYSKEELEGLIERLIEI